MSELSPKLIDRIHGLVHEYGQQHVLEFWDRLTEQQQVALTSQLAQIDFPLVQSLFEQHRQAKDSVGSGRDLSTLAPPKSIRLNDNNVLSYEQAYATGEELLQAGRVGVVIVAGGQGSRLGFNHPKGLFPIGPLSERTLFEFILDKLAGYENKYQTRIPLFIMTSPTVHAETVAYFQSRNFFGRSDRIEFFCQNTMPAVDASDGKLLLKSTYEIFSSPNGHGGMLEAMQQQEILARCAEQGLDTLFYGQVDNPLSPTCSPALLGYHAASDAEVTLQTIAKQSADDRTGNIVSLNDRTQIIEYSEMPDEFARQVDDQNQLKYWAANIAVHVFQTGFLQTVATTGGLPYHFARKRVNHINQDGALVTPDAPNAIKFERFIFDLLPLAESTVTVEAERQFVFAPVKNSDSAGFSSPQTSREGIGSLHRHWLQTAGCLVNAETVVEIHPAYAVDLPHLLQRKDIPLAITQDTYLCEPEN